MATYAELTAAYQTLERGGGDKWRFQQAHPKWWDRYRAEKATAAEAAPVGAAPPEPPATPEPVVHQYPDGSFLTVYPDGRRVLTYPDGSTKELAPGQSITDPTLADPTRARPPKPPVPPVLAKDGWDYIWDNDSQTWVLTQGDKPPEAFNNDLFTLYRDTLAQFGFTGEGVEDFLKQSVKEDWNASTFTIKMRQQDWYLKNPLYSANLARSAAGGRFMAEAEVLAYADSARQLARHFGFKEPSDAYIAQAIQGGMSVAEFEHRLTVQDRVNQFGGGVAMVYEALMGTSPSDQDLYEIFDPEISTKEFDDRARAAEMRGRPLLLGLGLRSAEEQRALELLGVTPEAAWQGYQQLANALPSVSRLAAIDQSVANDPNNPFDSFGALFSAIFEGGPQADKAREALEALRTREQARFRTSGTPVGAQGQLVGLLSPTERASFG